MKSFFSEKKRWKKAPDNKEVLKQNSIIVSLAWAFIDAVMAVLLTCSALLMAHDMIKSVHVLTLVLVFIGIFVFAASAWNTLYTVVCCQNMPHKDISRKQKISKQKISKQNNLKQEIFKHKILRHVINLGVLLFIAVLLLRFSIKNHDELYQGALYVINQYMKHFDKYYLTSYYSKVGDKAYTDIFVKCVCIFVGSFLGMLSQATRRKWIMTILPLVIFLGQLAVGLSPSFIGFILFCGCTLFCLSPDVRYNGRLSSAVVYAVILTVMFLFVGVALDGVAVKIADKKEEMFLIQQDLEKKVSQFVAGNYDLQNGVISNKYPSYEEKEVLRVAIDSEPESKVYLRGSYGDTYKDGAWKIKKSVTNLSKETGLDISFESSRGSYLYLQQRMAHGDYDSLANFTIKYTDLSSTIAYVPYASCPSDILEMLEADQSSSEISNESKISLENDYVFKKNRSTDSVEVQGSNYLYFTGDLQSSTFIPQSSEKFNEESAQFFDAYNEFVMENYLDVSDSMTEVKKLASTLEERAYDGTVLSTAQEDDDSDEITGKSYMQTLSDTSDINEYRIYLANYVQSYLTTNYKYSLAPKSSGSADNIEYFLSESKEGFCAHFASAGTLILRSMGVPARYVTGYSVPKVRFHETDEGYEGIVYDSNAHAWTEIYLDNYGWIPVEMTPGYYKVSWQNEGVYEESENVWASDEDSSNASDLDSNNSDTNNSDKGNSEADDSEVNSLKSNDLSDDSGDKTSSDNKNSTSNNDGAGNSDGTKNYDGNAGSNSGDGSGTGNGDGTGSNDGTGNSDGIGNGNGTENSNSSGSGAIDASKTSIGNIILKITIRVLKVFALIAMVLSAVFGAVYLVKRKNRLWEERIQRLVKRGRYKKAARMVNNKIFKMASRSKEGIIKRPKSDVDYEKLLTTVFKDIDWNCYMFVMKKAVFSNKEISKDEWMTVYHIWQKISGRY